MRPIKKLASDTLLYGLSSVVGRMLNYLLVPFHTSLFSPADYGVITELYAYAALLQVIYTYGMETTYFRFAAQGKEAFHTAVSVLLTSSLVFSGLLLLWATPIATALSYPGSERYLYYLAAILTLDTVLAIPLAQLRLQKRALFFASTKLLQISLNIVLNLALLYGCTHGALGPYSGYSHPWIARFYSATPSIEYVLMANLVANASALLLLGPSLRQLHFQLPWQQLRPMLAYAFPLLVMGLAGTVNEMLARAMLRHWLPPGFYPGQSNEAVLGIFGACYKLSVFMLLGIQAFRYAAEPFFFSHAQERSSPQLFSTVMYWFTLAGCFILFAVSANLDLLAYLFLRQAEYRTAIEIVPYLLLSYLLLGMYYNLSVWFKLTDKTYYGAWLTSIGALVTIVLNVVLIPRLGYWGSVWAAVTSAATMSLLCYYWGQKYYPIPYQLGHKLAYILGTLGCVYGARSIVYESLGQAVVSNFVLTLLFWGGLYGLVRFKMIYKS
ncbi:MAG: oligosaccharide flippase family protein [Roseivirga sp.]